MFPKFRNGKERQISRVGTWFDWMCWVDLLGVGWKYFEFRPKSGRIATKYRFVINLSTFYYQNASTPPMSPASCFPMCPLTFSLLLATTCYRRWRILYGFFIRIELLPSAQSNASPGRFIFNNWLFIGLESVPELPPCLPLKSPLWEAFDVNLVRIRARSRLTSVSTSVSTLTRWLYSYGTLDGYTIHALNVYCLR
jgi:hypothetical protein